MGIAYMVEFSFLCHDYSECSECASLTTPVLFEEQNIDLTEFYNDCSTAQTILPDIQSGNQDKASCLSQVLGGNS